mmetsp:Transcript_15882/g.22300  ORF Transcript_15882/g.22300 Transcript_15882/m.22300 type:complete len:138 (+) Transcript_15882:131-544(+)
MGQTYSAFPAMQSHALSARIRRGCAKSGLSPELSVVYSRRPVESRSKLPSAGRARSRSSPAPRKRLRTSSSGSSGEITRIWIISCLSCVKLRRSLQQLNQHYIEDGIGTPAMRDPSRCCRGSYKGYSFTKSTSFSDA